MLRRLLGLLFLTVACDKAKPPEVEEGVLVKDYCKKLITLDEKTAKANGAELGASGGPDRETLTGFCQMMFNRAKKKEPEAYACMAACMMDAESREQEQQCIGKKKCLAKAQNPKLFSNRAD